MGESTMRSRLEAAVAEAMMVGGKSLRCPSKLLSAYVTGCT